MNVFCFAQTERRSGISGIVKSADGNLLLPGVNVVLKQTVIGTITNQSGEFTISRLISGKYTVIFTLIGYKKSEAAIELGEGESKSIEVILQPVPVQTEPVIVTASRREQSLQETPASVSIIHGSELNARNADTIDRLLQYVPGVNITRGQVNVRGSTGYSYGIGTRVLLLLDGMPFLSGDTEEIIWESIPSIAIDRIEVVKGAGSALYGSSALGGVINVITKPVMEEPETYVKVYGGTYSSPSYSKWEWSDKARTLSGLSASRLQKFGDLALGVGVSRTLDDGFKRNDYWKRWNGWSRVGYTISPYQSVSVSFNYMDQRRGNFLYWKDLDHAIEPQDDQLEQGVHSVRWNLTAGYNHFLSNDLYYTVRASWYRSDWNDNVPSIKYPEGSSSISDNILLETQVNYQMSDHHYLTGGLLGSFNRVDAMKIFGTHNVLGGAAYIQDEIKLLASLLTTVGVRLDLQKMEDAATVNRVNPKLGIVYNPFATLTIRASAGSGFRVPSVAEIFTNTDAGGLTILPNPDLKPERSWSYEIGGTYIPLSEIEINASGFVNDFQDLIEPTFGLDGNVHFQNITSAQISGVEGSVGCFLFDRIWNSKISYMYIYPEDRTKHDLLKYRPRKLFYISTEITPEPFRFGFDYRYLSRVERIDQEFVYLGIVPDGDQRVPISVLDLHASLDWQFAGLPLITRMNINNLFQYYYVDMIGNMGSIRNYLFTLESKF
ncbi:MAG: TonB-dependent receptor [Ignavibacteriales bacterium]|nr:TonB-dependent receptor [Ignavibacteriales bacterium]